MIVFSLLAILAFAAGALILGNAQSAIHEIEGWLCFILGAMFCAAALLAAINEKLAAIKKLLSSTRDDGDKRAKSVGEVATERWETLCASLDKLEAATKKNRPPSNVGEDFEPTPAYATEPVLKAKCPKCSKMVKAKADWAGRTGSCPKCGGPIRFETPTDFGGVV